MKKEKSLNFLSSKWLMVTFLALGILLFSNVDAKAQSPFTERIASMSDLRDSFAPGTAKYDTVQDAIDYLQVLEANSIANPNYLNDLSDQTGSNPLMSDKLRRTHATILKNYTAAELAVFSGQMTEYTSGVSPNPAAAQKVQWILDANAY